MRVHFERFPWLCSGVNVGVATSRSQRRVRPLSGTALRCRDMPFPAKGAAAVGHSSTVSRHAVPSKGGGRCRAQLYGVATCRSQQRGRPLSGTALRCRDMPFPAKGAAAVGHSSTVSRHAVPSKGGGRCRAPRSRRALSANGGVVRLETSHRA